MLGKYLSQKMDKGIMTLTSCLPCEDIAAFVDDRLDRTNRERVLSHMADCRECYTIYADTLAVKAIITGRADMPTQAKHINRLLLYGIPTALAACLVLLIFSGVFNKSPQNAANTSEMKMPSTVPVPVELPVKKPEIFNNLSGNSIVK